MPISRVEVDEYECALCGYKWISRINGKDGPIPKRCAKCKHQHWEKGHIDPLEKSWRDALKKRFGYFYYPGGMFHGGWRIEENIMRYLERRPSVEEMKTILEPMCYLFENSKVLYDERYKSWLLKKLELPSERQLKTFKRKVEDQSVKTKEDATKARDYQIQLSRQLLKDLMIQRGIPYDEDEAKMTSVYSRHGKYATFMVYQVPKLCDALKQDWPEASNEDIKAKILEEWSKELKHLVASPEEVIQSCWPDWLK